MEKENTRQPEAAPPVLKDLTVSETETTNIKGGTALDYLLVNDGIKGETEAGRVSITSFNFMKKCDK